VNVLPAGIGSTPSQEDDIIIGSVVDQVLQGSGCNGKPHTLVSRNLIFWNIWRRLSNMAGPPKHRNVSVLNTSWCRNLKRTLVSSERQYWSHI